MGVQYDKVSTILPIIEELNVRAVSDGFQALIQDDSNAVRDFAIEAEAYKRVYQGIQLMIEAGLAD